MNLNLKIIRISIKYEISERTSYFKQYFMVTVETVMNKCFLFFRYCTVYLLLTGKIKGLAGQTSIGCNSSLLHVVQIQTCNLSSQSLRFSIVVMRIIIL